MLKKIFIFILLLVIAVTASGCGSSPTAKEKMRVGIIRHGLPLVADKIVDSFKSSLASPDFDVVFDDQTATDDATAATISKSFVDDKMDLIFSVGTTATMAAVEASAGSIPVVFGAIPDPVVADIVVDEDNSTNENVTGVTNKMDTDLLLYILIYLDVEDGMSLYIYNTTDEDAKNSARTFGNAVQTFKNTTEYKSLKKGAFFPDSRGYLNYGSRSHFLAILNLFKSENYRYTIMATDPNMSITDAETVKAKLTDKNKQPAIGLYKEQCEMGWFAAVGPDYELLGAACGEKALRILKGEEAYNIKIENQKSDLYINKTTAQILDISTDVFLDKTPSVIFME